MKDGGELARDKTVDDSDRLKYLTVGQIREEIAYSAGADPTRYGVDSDRGLRKADVIRIGDQLQPADSDVTLAKMDLGNLYDAVCRWAGGEYQPNAGKPWGINRDNLKKIHRAVGASDPREIITDGGLEEVFRRETIRRCECGDVAIGDHDCGEEDDELITDGGEPIVAMRYPDGRCQACGEKIHTVIGGERCFNCAPGSRGERR